MTVRASVHVLIATAVAVLLVLFAPGCRPSTTMRAKRAPLQVLCAPAMKPPVEEIAEAYRAATGETLEITYANSGALLGKLELSQQGDVFLPADESFVATAQGKGLVEDARTIAWLVPVIMVQKGNPRQVRTLQDLTSPKVRVGLGDERGPAIGKVAASLLRKNGVDPASVNAVFHADTVDLLGNAVKLGNIDATIIWEAVARTYPEGEIIAIPMERNLPIAVSAAMVRSSQQKDAVRRFLDFLVSEQGKAILARHHYDTTPPKETHP